MLNITSGSYSEIEQAFLRHLVSLKKDPFAKVAVVSPSLRLLDRLQQQLAHSGLSALNIHFHSFNSLAAEIVNEGKGLPKPVLSDPLFFETLVRVIQKEDKPIKSFDDLAVPEGFPPAVRETLRDLMDSGANADIGEAVKEGFLGKDVDVGWLRELLRLYRIYLKRVEQMPVLPKIAVLKEATRLAPKSTGLSSFNEILFYGFYDLTGVQVDFFHAIVKNHPSHFYFPWISEHPAYVFANRFRDNFLQPVIQEQTVLDSKETPPADIKLLNVSGLRDEAWLVAARLIELHEKEGVPYEQMAVVARSRERLARELPFALRERKIPFQTTATQPIQNTPYIIELKEIFESAAWPEKGTWDEYIQLASTAVTALETSGAAEDDLKNSALASITLLAVFKEITDSISKTEFLETLQSRWRGTPLPQLNAPRGVALMHAEAARGLRFRALFLIGAEDRVFPRVLKEDPFLRDDARLALNNTLGYKISQKMTALEEERLLFHLLTHAAETLTITFQRSDDEGKIVGPSVFLRTFAETTGRTFEEWEESWPRIYSEKIAKINPTFLGFVDATLYYLSNNALTEAVGLSKALGKDADAFAAGLAAVKELNKFTDPGVYDGLIGKELMSAFLKKRTLSPTGLERFALCPFKFLGLNVWGLKELEETRPLEAFDTRVKGQIVHTFLENFYKPYLAADRPKDFPETHFQATFDAVIGGLLPETVRLHPLMWTIIKALLKSDLEFFLRNDWDDLDASQTTLLALEEKLTPELAVPLNGIRWSGKIDRLERVGKNLRIIDYKTGQEPPQELIKRLQKGRDAQPILYRLFVEEWLKKNPPAPEEISFIYSYLNNASRELTEFAWQTERKSLIQAMAEMLAHLKAGEFPIRPGNHCSYCEIESICRKNDSVSRFRAQFAGAAAEDEE